MMKATSIPIMLSVVIFGSKNYGLTLKELYLEQLPPGLITEAWLKELRDKTVAKPL